jgi:Zn-dependent protease
MNPEMLYDIALLAIPIIIAITFHEAAHGFVANHFGDDTAKREGRVTLNPIKHIDPFGTILMPLLLYVFTPFIFGYAKPVPVDESRLRHPRRDVIFVAAAGAAMNVLLGVTSAVLLYFATDGGTADVSWLSRLLDSSIQINFLLAVFNMLPIPPLDGSKVVAPLLPEVLARPYVRLESIGIVLLLLLLVVLPVVGLQMGMDLNFLSWIVLEPTEWAHETVLSWFGMGAE